MICFLNNFSVFVRFEILTAFFINIQVLWDVMLCFGLQNVMLCFGLQNHECGGSTLL
jgi:hypothetical protein